MQEHTLITSVVIVGSWGAGLRCAIELWEQGQKDILIIWDRKFDDAHTVWARWGINAAMHTMDPEDTPLIHAVDTYREWQHLANPYLVEKLTSNAPNAIEDLVTRWAQFHREDNGDLTQRFFWAHTYRRTCFSGDQTWLEMIRVLTKKANELEIPYMEHVYVYDLVTHDNRVIWVRAVKWDMHYFIQAPHVVFATWWYSNVYARSSSRSKENFGDGISMAFRAWAKIGDIELVQFHPTGLLYPEEHSGELVTEAVRGEWWILTNANGERFMSTYDPEKMELSTRDVVARANFQEIQEWRGTPKGWVWLDISHRGKVYILERLPKMHSMILEYNNVDISQAPVEVAPTSHYTMWGIRFDYQTMKTTIEGFWVAGECSMWVHGANRLGGNSLMETMVFGKSVAQAILASTAPEQLNKPVYGARLLERITSEWVDPIATREHIRQRVRDLAGIVKDEAELLELQAELTELEDKVMISGINMQDGNQESIVAANRLHSVLELAHLICKGALERKESRGAHYRKDFMEPHDMYRKNYMHQVIEWKFVSTREELPVPSPTLQQGLDHIEETKNYQHLE